MTTTRKTLTPEDVRKWTDAGADVCPFCSAEDVDYDRVEIDCGGAYQKAWCNACGARWDEGYTLDRILPRGENAEIDDEVIAAKPQAVKEGSGA
jgi:hypothetical protein